MERDLKADGWIQNPLDKACFMKFLGDGELPDAMLLIHVDDLRVHAVPSFFSGNFHGLKEKWGIDKWEFDIFKYIGVNYVMTEDYGFR